MPLGVAQVCRVCLFHTLFLPHSPEVVPLFQHALRFEWVNFNCEPEDRGTIKPGKTFEQVSYPGHVFRVSYYASESDEPRWIEFKRVVVSPSNKSMNIIRD